MKFAVIASLLFSILATVLFFGQKLGISIFLFVLPFLCCTIYLIEKHQKVKNRKGYFLAVIITLLSITYAIYQNTLFQVSNIFVMLLLYNIMLIWCMNEKYRLEFAVRRISRLITRPFCYMKETCNAIGETFPMGKVKKENQSTKFKIIKQIGIGIAVSLPILIVVIILLCSADVDFSNKIQNILNFLFKDIIYLFNLRFWFSLTAKLLIIAALTLYFISFIINLLSRVPWQGKEERNVKIQIETIILNTVVTILNVIYILFCYIQIVSLLQASDGTIFYANYARKGFFQLMLVSLINFAIIIITTQNTKQSSKGQIYYRKTMNMILAIATIIILVSAFLRMNLYSEAYGYTFLRMFVYFALITEAILMIPTIVYILKDKFSPWKSYFIIVVIMYVVMNFSNIPHMIAEKNVDRYLNHNSKLDINYLTKTKEDGLEEVIKLYENTENPELKGKLEVYFRKLKEELNEQDNIIEWNYARAKARKLLEGVRLSGKIYNYEL